MTLHQVSEKLLLFVIILFAAVFYFIINSVKRLLSEVLTAKTKRERKGNSDCGNRNDKRGVDDRGRDIKLAENHKARESEDTDLNDLRKICCLSIRLKDNSLQHISANEGDKKDHRCLDNERQVRYDRGNDHGEYGEVERFDTLCHNEDNDNASYKINNDLGGGNLKLGKNLCHNVVKVGRDQNIVEKSASKAGDEDADSNNDNGKNDRGDRSEDRVHDSNRGSGNCLNAENAECRYDGNENDNAHHDLYENVGEKNDLLFLIVDSFDQSIDLGLLEKNGYDLTEDLSNENTNVNEDHCRDDIRQIVDEGADEAIDRTGHAGDTDCLKRVGEEEKENDKINKFSDEIH